MLNADWIKYAVCPLSMHGEAWEYSCQPRYELSLYNLCALKARWARLPSDNTTVSLIDKTWHEYNCTPGEGLNLAYQKSRKLGAFGWKLEGSHSLFYR